MQYEILDKAITEIIKATTPFVTSRSGDFVLYAKAIAGLLVLFVVAQEAYKMIAKQEPLDLLFWLRPLVISIILGSWPFLPNVINNIGHGLNATGLSVFERATLDLDKLKAKKEKLLEAKWDSISHIKAELNTAKEALEEKDWGDKIYDATIGAAKEAIENKIEETVNTLVNRGKLFVFEVGNFFSKILEWIGGFVWQISVLMTMFSMHLSIAFLTVFGPIAFGFSVFDTWRDAWATWLMRLFSFQFYGWVAYVIISASAQIVRLGVEHDIAVLSQPGFPQPFNFSTCYTLFGYIIGAYAMKMVPEIVSWIVPTSASQAAANFASSTTNTALSPLRSAGDIAAAYVTRGMSSATKKNNNSSNKSQPSSGQSSK